MAMTNLRAQITFTMPEELKARLAAAEVKLKAASKRLQDAACKNPWVVVGRTTIDGTPQQVSDMLNVSSEWSGDAEHNIDLFMRSPTPWLIGGRYLLPKSSRINSHGDIATAIIRCDIVRRQSEIDAEKVSALTSAYDKVATDVRPALGACPECGPHGNAGRVLLASTWVACTVCAGGKPGDAFGAVKAADDSLPFGLDRMTVDDVRSAMRTRLTSMMEQREIVAHTKDAKFEGFVVPTASEVNAAMSASLIAEGASNEVAQAGVRAFMQALDNDAVAGFHVPTRAELANYLETEYQKSVHLMQVPADVLLGATPSAFDELRNSITALRHPCQDGAWEGFIAHDDGSFECRRCSKAIVEAKTLGSIETLQRWQPAYFAPSFLVGS